MKALKYVALIGMSRLPQARGLKCIDSGLSTYEKRSRLPQARGLKSRFEPIPTAYRRSRLPQARGLKLKQQ